MTKKVTRRHFTDQFLWTVIVVVLLAFIALWIYQKTMKPGTSKPTSTENQAMVADNLKTANQEALENIDLTLSEVPPLTSTDHLLGPIEAPAQLIIYTDFRIYNTKSNNKNKKDVKINIKFKPDDNRDSSLVDIKIYCGNVKLNKVLQFNKGKHFVIETTNYSKSLNSYDKVEIPLALITTVKEFITLFANDISKKDMEHLSKAFNNERLIMMVDNFKDSTNILMYIK